MAQSYHGDRRDVLSFFYGHMGQTVYTMSGSGNRFRSEPFNFAPQGIVKVPAPHCFRCFYNQTYGSCGIMCADRIEQFLEFATSGPVAAIIIEPIFGNGDNITPPREFLVRLREICTQHDITLIFDEVQTGIGRTGEMYAADYFGVYPDIMTVAKGLGGTGFQTAAIICNERYTKMDPMHHSFTYGSNLLAAVAGLKTLEIVQRPGFLENVRRTGGFLKAFLDECCETYREIGDSRGVGLMLGFELVDEMGRPDVALMRRVRAKAFENGLILRASRYDRGSVLKIRPPLILSEDEAYEIRDRLKDTFDHTLRSST